MMKSGGRQDVRGRDTNLVRRGRTKIRWRMGSIKKKKGARMRLRRGENGGGRGLDSEIER